MVFLTMFFGTARIALIFWLKADSGKRKDEGREQKAER